MKSIDASDLPQLTRMAGTLRLLCADMVQAANSGHPGAPMGLADIAVILGFYIRVNPSNPTWLNRDRLIFSGGHVSALVYSLLHLWGFDVSLNDLRNFRQLDSKTPGHPEFSHTPGIEVTTGPLGQGIANAVGMALASKHAKNSLNQTNKNVINHNVFCFCGDGDLQEGISYEACSLAGLHKLENLILIYDSNNVSIEGNVDRVFVENLANRFDSQGFEVIECNGHDFIDINEAFQKALDSQYPSIIIAHTIIGKGAIDLEGSHKTHGAPLGIDVLAKTKQALGFNQEEHFVIPQDCLLRFRNVAEIGALANQQWESLLDSQIREKIAKNLDFSHVKFPCFEQGSFIATRVSNGKIINCIAESVSGFLGGSADLAPSNNTDIVGDGDFPAGRNIRFGIREHAMGAICNGIANYGLYTPFCATFFVFSDYLAPSIRIASLMNARVFYVFTHDSIGVGEDGATHQPIEQLSHFRAMPNLLVFRPCDANENVACWQVALKRQNPSMFVLSRQNLEVISNPNVESVAKGAYILSDCKNPQITLVASGSEVALSLRVQHKLNKQGVHTRVVSAPCFDLLLEQDRAYLASLFGDSKVLAIEASRGFEWYKFAHSVYGINSFGASGKGDMLFERFGFDVQNLAEFAKNLLSI